MSADSVYEAVHFFFGQVIPGMLLAVGAHYAKQVVDSIRRKSGLVGADSGGRTAGGENVVDEKPRLGDYLLAFWLLPVGVGFLLLAPLAAEVDGWWVTALVVYALIWLCTGRLALGSSGRGFDSDMMNIASLAAVCFAPAYTILSLLRA